MAVLRVRASSSPELSLTGRAQHPCHVLQAAGLYDDLAHHASLELGGDVAETARIGPPQLFAVIRSEATDPSALSGDQDFAAGASGQNGRQIIVAYQDGLERTAFKGFVAPLPETAWT